MEYFMYLCDVERKGEGSQGKSEILEYILHGIVNI